MSKNENVIFIGEMIDKLNIEAGIKDRKIGILEEESRVMYLKQKVMRDELTEAKNSLALVSGKLEILDNAKKNLGKRNKLTLNSIIL